MSKRRPKSNKVENRMVSAIDNLAAFEEFQDEILPELRKMLKVGASAEAIYKKATAVAAARAVSIAVRDPDSSKALSAIKEILDRSGGKATERQEVSHKLEKLPDEQLDALLLSKLQEADEHVEDEDLPN